MGNRFRRFFLPVSALLLIMSMMQYSPAKAAAAVNYHRGINGIVCLTIDDGYGRQHVKQALDVLRSRNVKCTFFIIGNQLKALPDLWRQAARDGHEICYHSTSHRILSSWSREAILADVRRWNSIARSVLGQGYQIPKLARLPGGSGQHNDRIQRIFDSIGYKLVYWSADTYTGVIRYGTRNVRQRIASYIRSTTGANSIILTHFNGYDTPALPLYIDWLKSHFRLGKVSKALATGPIIPDKSRDRTDPPKPMPPVPVVCRAWMPAAGDPDR